MDFKTGRAVLPPFSVSPYGETISNRKHAHETDRTLLPPGRYAPHRWRWAPGIAGLGRWPAMARTAFRVTQK